MMKFVFLTFRVNLFAVSQSYSLQSSWFTINSSDLGFLSAYRIFVSTANRKNGVSANRRPKTKDRKVLKRFFRCQKHKIHQVFVLFDPKTLKSIGSSFCSFTRLKVQNEDPGYNALFDPKTLKSKGPSFCSFTRLILQNEDPR